MTEPTTEGGLSLLPYLESRAPGLRLTLTDIAASTVEASSAAAPEFSGPFTTLWHARITLDGLQALSEAFLLIQPDHYGQRPSALPAVANPQVDTFWQEMAVRLRTRDECHGPLFLPGQLDAQGRLTALRPLFYCRHRQRYAHVPCPGCGGVLALCRDDQILQAGGLQTYGATLARYLFCPTCQGQPAFYAREALPEGPAHLRDARFLVESFSRLLSREQLKGELPCIGCPEATACYGPQTLVHQRMAPLCFYPFHMLILPAPTISSEYVMKMWLQNLRQEIQALWADTAPAPATPAMPLAAPPVRDAEGEPPAAEVDARIAGILRTILSQWPDAGVAAQKKVPAVAPRPATKIPPAPPKDADGDSVETVILGVPPRTPANAGPATPPPSPDLEKTVLIQPPAAAQQPPSQDLQATVLISPATAEPPGQGAGEELEKTVLMGTAPPVPPKAAPEVPPQPPAPDDLAETVIISPDPAKGRRPKP